MAKSKSHHRGSCKGLRWTLRSVSSLGLLPVSTLLLLLSTLSLSWAPRLSSSSVSVPLICFEAVDDASASAAMTLDKPNERIVSDSVKIVGCSDHAVPSSFCYGCHEAILDL